MGENGLFTLHVKYDPICVETLKKNVEQVSSWIEMEIASVVSDKLSLVFHGWITYDSHYVPSLQQILQTHRSGFSR